ncbi:hypothetical protein EI42_01006 [Thermosporothrix hazakensis]|jgi:hypothetical protein|uniref:Uncharacterized protein n=2 Tax=Thermosporothrix TaxID=768650 RepID=A0A326UJJ8_THEHA|nr:hypothetical protein [Thermosporothrix hazakensis]PZW36820.1 hypothetical protein EI42_01006 [Thermosporothrix hazakensis]BBH89286.1 hypothetical protein KTC_40370 [Thermosporothrix sp. COM3]GCE47469.1 hypothetical protein KTH_23380 [Thermosporothrix hazakensis]
MSERNTDPYLHNSGHTPSDDKNADKTYAGSASNSENRGYSWPDDKAQQDEIEKTIDDIKRMVVQGASEAQQRIRRVVDKAGDYWQKIQEQPTPRQANTVEEQRLRQLLNMWSNENWRIAKDLGSYAELHTWDSGEVWEATLQTRWESRQMEIVSEPYTGQTVGAPKPLLPVWDYELPQVVGLKPPQTRTRLENMDEIVSCTNCNGTGHVLCANCTGRGWVVCPDCKGRTKKRCTTCRGRGYIADTEPGGTKKPFFKRQAEGVSRSISGKFSDLFEGIRQKGVPIPNPIDSDPAEKGPTIPCPDCVKGEMPCTCGNGKRVCETCEGSRMMLCKNCNGTSKLVRHREIARRFDLRTRTEIIGQTDIPAQQLLKAGGDIVFNTEVNEPLYAAAPPDGVPAEVWSTVVNMVDSETRQGRERSGTEPQLQARPTLQVIELARIPYTRVFYRFGDHDYVVYIYDSEGSEKFYAEQFPARWDNIGRLFKAITADLTTPVTVPNPDDSNRPTGGYRVPVEVPPEDPNNPDTFDEHGGKNPYRYK